MSRAISRLMFLACLFSFSCSTVPPDNLKVVVFAEEPSLTVGQNTDLFWRVNPVDDGLLVFLVTSGVDGKEEVELLPTQSGSKSIMPTVNTTYTILVRMQGDSEEKIVAQSSCRVEMVAPPPPPPPIVEEPIEEFKSSSITYDREVVVPDVSFPCSEAEIGIDDGRFTIGVVTPEGPKRLMYGFPIPHSTSHFVIRIGDKFASNNPVFAQGNTGVCYLTGFGEVIGESGSIHFIVRYTYGDAVIEQRLIPVDANFEPVTPNSWGQYYRIEYSVHNTGHRELTISLLALVDTMIDDNDAAQFVVNGVTVSAQSSLLNTQIPDDIFVPHHEGVDALTGHFNFTGGSINSPDIVHLGKWPVMHSEHWITQLANVSYFDSGLIGVWDNESVRPDEVVTFAMHYGTTSADNRVKGLLHIDFASDVIVFNFAPGSRSLNAAAKAELQAFLAGREIVGAIVEGFADAIGSETINERVSKMRAQDVRRHLADFSNLSEDEIVLKYHGERYASQDQGSRNNGNSSDRKVVVKILVL